MESITDKQLPNFKFDMMVYEAQRAEQQRLIALYNRQKQYYKEIGMIYTGVPHWAVYGLNEKS